MECILLHMADRQTGKQTCTYASVSLVAKESEQINEYKHFDAYVNLYMNDIEKIYIL